MKVLDDPKFEYGPRTCVVRGHSHDLTQMLNDAIAEAYRQNGIAEPAAKGVSAKRIEMYEALLKQYRDGCDLWEWKKRDKKG